MVGVISEIVTTLYAGNAYVIWFHPVPWRYLHLSRIEVGRGGGAAKTRFPT